MKKSIIVLLILSLLSVSCQRQPRLVILHTNDIHSHFEPIRSGEYACKGGVIERAALIDSVRNVYGEDKVLLLDAGDFSQGSSYFSELGGELEIAILNDMKYDCVTLGNHEFDNNIEALEQRLAKLEGTKVVSANIDLSQFPISKYVSPYTVIERAGMKIGIIGLESNLAANVSAAVSDRIPQLDNLEVTNSNAAILKDTLGCDMVILLSHIGYEEDLALIPGTRNIDLVIGGHSHTFVDDIVYVRDLDGRKVPVITDGCWGLQLGEIKIW